MHSYYFITVLFDKRWRSVTKVQVQDATYRVNYAWHLAQPSSISNLRKLDMLLYYELEHNVNKNILYLHLGYAAPPFIEQHRNKTTLKLCCSHADYHQLD
ncbi:hypothetical protein T06_3520 [Trichinella sp. T6]|nr:hypothetical protein T06_3520 [Trichinella sp. T6]